MFHSSPVTEVKAGGIYSNWIQNFLNSFKTNSILVAQYHGNIVGFGLIEENDIAVDLVWGCVGNQARGLGVYKTITSSLAQYAIS